MKFIGYFLLFTIVIGHYIDENEARPSSSTTTGDCDKVCMWLGFDYGHRVVDKCFSNENSHKDCECYNHAKSNNPVGKKVTDCDDNSCTSYCTALGYNVGFCWISYCWCA